MGKMGSSQGNRYLALKHIAKVANSTSSLKKICNSIASSTAKAIHANGCRILSLSPQKEYLLTVGTHGLSDLYLRKGPLNAHKSLPDILDGKVVFIADATKDEKVQHPQIAQAQGISSIFGVPILKKGAASGEIRVYTREPHQFSEADKGFLLSVADFYRIEWLYEPRSFPLKWENGGVTEMFTPDFYLPELDLYVELTTLKQSLITEKYRKFRRLKELYPEINIKLLNKSDYLQLLAKYGYGSLGEAKIEGVNRVLYSHTQIQRRVRVLARRISHDYAGKQLVLVGILKGVICFMADLMQHLSLPVTLDFMAISYYGGDGQMVKITKDFDSNMTGQHIVMVEDIVDTGMTLNYVLNHLSAHNPASLRVCTLLDKRARRLIDVPLDYVGFEIPDEFVVGYGLDYKGQYRNLPFIGILYPELIKEDESQ
jgi:hypoxanthine phosphoribosyltransferase